MQIDNLFDTEASSPLTSSPINAPCNLTEMDVQA